MTPARATSGPPTHAATPERAPDTVFDVLWVDVPVGPLDRANRSCTTSREGLPGLLAVRRFDIVVTAPDTPVPAWETGPPALRCAPEDARTIDRRLTTLPATWFDEGDPDVAPLRASFGPRLAARVERLAAALREEDRTTICHLAHQVSGTARLYGYVALEWESDGLRRAARHGTSEDCQWQLARVLRAAARPA